MLIKFHFPIATRQFML